MTTSENGLVPSTYPDLHVVRIDDPDDDRLTDYLRLTDIALRSRDEPAKGLYIAESSTVIGRALDAGHQPRSFLMAERWLPDLADRIRAAGQPGKPVPVYLGDPEILEAITGFHLHRGALAAMHRPLLASVQELLGGKGDDGARRVAVLENIVDHTNVGAIFRSAAALGMDAVLVTPSCSDPLYRRSVRVSMGTVFQVPWTRIEPWPGGIAMLQELGYRVAGMTLGAGAITLDELAAQNPPKLALVFGTEGHGLTLAADRLLDDRVTIPMMNGVDSLNVAASSAVAFYGTRPTSATPGARNR